ncbi:hypothetical protein PSV09DRAFT_2375063 [Bipolaris maydis]|nr:hypothetical protein J3E74DRAFT_430641 [Bipolaris maydis]KAJ6206917.1 hypothetical protein PSV09DRAFT_2375063 [Bipolaris maydis]
MRLLHTTREEVTFTNLKDLKNLAYVITQSKKRYQKLLFCAQQAKRDNKCYAFLSDIKNDNLEGNSKSAFRKKLLAPYSIKFFSKNKSRLENKESLSHIIHKITRIPIKALLETAKRQTTREEDGTYYLLGIFSKTHTIRRLQKKVDKASEGTTDTSTDNSKTHSQAPNPSTNYHKAHKQRIPECSKTILSSIVIKHVLEHYYNNTSIVTAYFYFNFNNTQKQSLELIFHSLLYQLLQRLVIIPKSVDILFSQTRKSRILRAL